MILIIEDGINKTNKTLRALANTLVNVTLQTELEDMFISHNGGEPFPINGSEIVTLHPTTDEHKIDRFELLDLYVEPDYVDVGYEGEVIETAYVERIAPSLAGAFERGAKPTFIRVSSHDS